jgi:hypothetical protein
MQADGQVIFQIEGDNKGLKSTLQDTTSAIQSESKKWDNAASSSSQGMQASFTGALKTMAGALAASKIGSMLADFGKQAINAASDLEEVQNVVDVTFGESANEINAWAKNAINQFGLTETQAKRFASTMGAMMKSSGIASKDIAEMSENLAGLAADMASFYNLDFDEAFNKIRSGISGETEPLKQLGINMSVANLEAFALSQGLKKTFNEMTQGEQVMLRYQYLMQATSDAQGDFARTSDGFANGLRLLQSNFEQLKTTIGSLLLPVVSQAISGLNDILGLLIPATKPTTVLDDFASIDLDTQGKLEAIKETKKEADALLTVINDISNAKITDNSGVISGMSEAANILSSSAGSNWTAFIGGLNGVDDVITDSKGGTQAGTDLENLGKGAETLTGNPVTKFKFSKLPGNLETLLQKAGQADTVKQGLGTIDQEAGKLTKDEQTKFKFGALVTDLGKLEGAADTAAQNTPTDFDTVASATDKVTGEETKKFKFGALTTGLSELEGAAGTAATELPTKLTKVDESASGLTGEGEQFKFENVKTGITELIGVANQTVTDKTVDELGAVQSSASELSGTKESFKYANLTDDTSGVSALITDANGGTSAGTELSNLGAGAQAVADVEYSSGEASPIKSMVGDIKLLKSSDKSNWTSILNVFNNLPGYAKKLDANTIEGIAGAFANLDGDKAGAWKTLMDALGSDLSALATLTGQDENGAAAWLEGMKEAANGLNSTDVAAWDQLLTKLAEGTPGAGNLLTFSDIYKTAEAMGVAESTYVELDGKTVSLTEANAMYLESLKRLVQVYPELNDMVNTETGEIKGGNTALEERIEAITKEHEKEVLLYALKQKRLALEKKFAELPTLRLDAAVAKLEFEKAQKAVDDLNKSLEKYGVQLDEFGHLDMQGSIHADEINAVVDALDEETLDLIANYADLKKAYEDAQKSYEEQQAAFEEASTKYDEFGKTLEGVTDKVEDGSNGLKEYSKEAKEAAADGVKALGDALKEVNDYVERTKKSTADSVDSALKGFKKYETAEEHLRNLKKNAQAEEKKWNEQEAKAAEQAAKNKQPYVKKSFTGYDDIPTISNMTKALDDQAAFMDEYRKNLATAQARGISEDLLGEFASDFSQESADFLYLIANSSEKELQAFKDSYNKMAKTKDPLTESLVELRLQADDEFNELVNKAKEAAINLNNGDVAKDSMASTVEGIANGIKEKVPEVKEAVDALNAELERLGSFADYNVFGELNTGTGLSFKFGVGADGSASKGMDYVPFDNYLAYLHEGESVLTAEEAAMWRNFKSGGSNLRNNIDYGQLSGAIWDNAPNMGGNVYLDGRTVGKVISAQQANSYRQLERSGWQG